MTPAARLAVQRRGGVLEIRMARPEARNAIDRRMAEELIVALDEVWSDEVGAAVIAGDGPAFSAGGDLKERRNQTVGETRALRRLLIAMFTKLSQAPVPVVAAVNGAARGGGFELALCCDFIVAADNAVLGLPEVDLGIIPGGGGTQHLVRLAGLARARQVILLGRMVSAADAHGAGLVHQVVAPAELDATARALAEELAAKPRTAVRQAKLALNAAWGYDIAVALAREGELYDPCLESPDRTGALERFATRTQP